MGDYQIVRTKQYPPGEEPDHARIVEVEIREGNRYRVQDIVGWIDRGEHRFWVNDPDTNQGVWVQTYDLHGRRHIKTKPNRTKRDNLDSLPTYN